MLVGENGIITQAQRAKEENEKASDRDKIAMAVSEAQIGENGYQELNSNNLQEAINNQFNGRNVVVSDNGDGTFTVSCLDTLKDYKVTSNGIEDGIDWNTILANIQKHPEQKTSTAIGVGIDGRAVNMDLWEYTLMEDGTYGLNDEESISAGETRTSSYSGNIINGQIEGTIPQYIKDETDETFIEVTDLSYLFFKNTDLEVAPKIPPTVTNMRATFNTTNIVIAPEIPYGVTNMYGTFASCTKLIQVPEIPYGVTNMYGTFNECDNLKQTPKIPDSVTNMRLIFQNCTSLTSISNISKNVKDLGMAFKGCTKLVSIEEIPESVNLLDETFFGCTNLVSVPEIPSSVTNMRATFAECTNLTGTIVINANLSGAIVDEDINDYYTVFWNAAINPGCEIKLTGTCPMLENIVKSTNKSNITLL